jgi:hypothetical protein
MSHGGGKPRNKKRGSSPQQESGELQTPHGHAGDHQAQTENPLPSLPIAVEKKDCDQRKNHSGAPDTEASRVLGMTSFELIMAVLTFAGLLIAFLTGTILLKQTYATIVDQRPWIVLNSGPFSSAKDNAGRDCPVDRRKVATLNPRP